MAESNNLRAGALLEVQSGWIAKNVEAAIDPQQKIVDPHHHLWDPPSGRYLFQEFLDDIDTGHNITSTIFAPCHTMYRATGPEEMKPIGETEFVVGVGAMSDSGNYGKTRVCHGVIGALNLLDGDRNGHVLDAHLRVAGSRFKGIRGRTAWHESDQIRSSDTPPGVMLDSRSQNAIRLIAQRGLSLDIWAFQTQFDDIAEVCHRFPDLVVVINHCGGPLAIGPYVGARQEMFAKWTAGIKQLGSFANAHMKIGGLGMRYPGFDFHKRELPPSSDELAAAWKPYVETCIEAFGPTRCMLESNFPVDKAMFSYANMWNAFKKLTSGYSPSHRDSLFHKTAEHVYRL